MKSFRIPSLVTLSAICLVAAVSAQARDASPFHRCVDAALEVKPGEVLEVEQEREDGGRVYEIEIRGADGRRWELKCDMATMKIIKVELDDDGDHKN